MEKEWGEGAGEAESKSGRCRQRIRECVRCPRSGDVHTACWGAGGAPGAAQLHRHSPLSDTRVGQRGSGKGSRSLDRAAARIAAVGWIGGGQG